jgi:hypothetical protein
LTADLFEAFADLGPSHEAMAEGAVLLRGCPAIRRLIAACAGIKLELRSATCLRQRP